MDYESLFKAARKAGTALTDVEPERLGRILQHAARLLRGHTPALLEANARDIEAMPASSPMLDRLRLTPERIDAIASDMEAVSHLRSPQGEELARWTRPNGMTIVKRRVPFGVVGMVCEARPNVTADIFALCVKTGNACVLKGGSDAHHSNEAIAALLHEALAAEGIDENTFTLLPAGHEAVGALLSAVGYVDVVIPRGGAGLIRFVRENARIPVIETGAGIVHTYFDIDGDLEKGRAVVCNAKTRRVSVCNALDCLVIHRGRLTDLPELCAPLAGAHVTVYADEEAFRRPRRALPRRVAGTCRRRAFRHRVPRLQTGRQDRRVARRGTGAYRPLLVAPQRGHRHRKQAGRHAVHAQRRRRLRLRQRLDRLHRRRAVRLRRRSGYLDAETPRPRPDGTARAHDLQVYRLGRRTNPPTLNPDTTKNLEKTAGKITIRKHFFCKFAYP